MSNDDENKRPSMNGKVQGKETSSGISKSKGQVQYRILQRGQPDEPTVTPKKIPQESNVGETSSSKSQRNRRKKEKQRFWKE